MKISCFREKKKKKSLDDRLGGNKGTFHPKHFLCHSQKTLYLIVSTKKKFLRKNLWLSTRPPRVTSVFCTNPGCGALPGACSTASPGLVLSLLQLPGGSYLPCEGHRFILVLQGVFRGSPRLGCSPKITEPQSEGRSEQV